MKISRRSFIKGGAALLGAAAASGIARDTSAAVDPKKEKAFLIDLTKCDGCQNEGTPLCVTACRDTNRDKFPNPVKDIPKVFPTHTEVDWSDRKDVTNRLTPYNWLFVQKIKSKGKETTYIPRRCMHCDNPPCANLCPWAVITKRAEGSVVINQDACLGGAKCKSVCPWNIPQRQSGVGLYMKLLPTLIGNGVMYKCDMCADRVREGKLPACVEACPNEAVSFGPKKDIIKLAHERKEATGGYLYGEKENGGTSTIYLSQVPFEELNREIRPKDGFPGLTSAKDYMKKFKNLASALLLIPAGGAIGAVGMALGSMKKEKTKDKQ